MTRTNTTEVTTCPPQATRRAGRKLALGLATLAAGSALTLAGGTTPASAAVGNCYHGIDSGTTNWAWGSCNGVTGNSHWRLHVSCTWGSTQYSSWIYGNARVDVQCPWPGSVRATQIDIIY